MPCTLCGSPHHKRSECPLEGALRSTGDDVKYQHPIFGIVNDKPVQCDPVAKAATLDWPLPCAVTLHTEGSPVFKAGVSVGNLMAALDDRRNRHLTVTTNAQDEAVLVSWQDDDHRIQEVVWERGEATADDLPPLPEPAGFRTRYRSEPGMIGHYPWTYADQRRRRVDRPSCETEDLFTADQMRAYAHAARASLAAPPEPVAPAGRFLLVAMDDDGKGWPTFCADEAAVESALLPLMFHLQPSEQLAPDHAEQFKASLAWLMDNGALRFEGDPGIHLFRLPAAFAAPTAPAPQPEPVNAQMLEALKEADQDFATEGFSRESHYRVPIRAAIAAAEAAPQASAPTRDDLVAALKFYASGEHFAMSVQDAWDTVSGEPQNWWCDEAGTATIEDGTIAKQTLAGKLTAEQINDMDDGEEWPDDSDTAAEAGSTK